MMRLFLLILFFVSLPGTIYAARFNAFNMEINTVETQHFRIHFPKSCEHLTGRVAAKFEELYDIYKNTYNLTLPGKTEVVILESDEGNGWSLSQTKTITINTVDFDFNLRGSHNWFDDVITHEYAHGVSIWASQKTESPVSDVRLGFFSHPNEKNRSEIFHLVPKSILPHWLTEGIAQHESSLHGEDSWDSHRDMILRTLTLSNQLLSWDHMQVFTGRGDDFEKTYNHGFSLINYISDTYGYGKVVSMLYESAKYSRLDFDPVIKSVLGISARKLYKDWRQSLEKHYKSQIDSLGTQVYGKKVSKVGYINVRPYFSPDDKSVYFLSNGRSAYGRTFLTIVPIDTSIDTSKIKNPLMLLRGSYDIDPIRNKIVYTASRDRKSILPPERGGEPTRDLFIHTLPDGQRKQFSQSHEKKRSIFNRRLKEKRLTTQQSIFSAAISPNGNLIAAAHRVVDHFELVLIDTTGKNKPRLLYPKEPGEAQIGYIYSVDWAPDGKNIVFSYFEKKSRNIAIYDTLNRTCKILFDTGDDERDPIFSSDGKYIYFSSDRTGMFNIYRYEIASEKIERVSNVAGGAFSPSVSSDGTKLVYSGYDKEGYNIYLIDTIRVLETITPKIAATARQVEQKNHEMVLHGSKQPYNFFPRQLLISPVFIGEGKQEPDKTDFHKISPTYKMGLVLNLIEPLTLSGIGSELGALFIIEPSHVFTNAKRNFDLTVFGNTNRTPLSLSFDYMLRGVSDKDYFTNETEGVTDKLDYGIRLHNLNFQISTPGGTIHSGNMNTATGLNLILGLNRYDVKLLYEGMTFQYNLSKGYRAGIMAVTISKVPEPESEISPRGLAAKLQYDFWGQNSLSENNAFTTVDKMQYDNYLFHQVTSHIKTGLTSPLHKKHVIHLDIKGTAIKIVKQDTTFPSFYLPGVWLPGYNYYFRSTKKNSKDSDIWFDTLLITGKAVMNGEISYRFPLWKGLINKKISFIHFERLYGDVHACGGAGWQQPRDFLKFNREDWLLSAGAELRLETKSFNTYPMAFKFRYDHGFDSDNYGGNRISFSLGFDFDGWDYLSLPDQKYPSFVMNNKTIRP
jgi:Tol biopolymer transport system component